METGAVQYAKSLVSPFFSMCCLYFPRGGDEPPPARNHDLGASQSHFFMLALKKERFTFLFSNLSVILSEILHAFVTIPEPWAGIFKALSAAAPSKMIDDCESRRKHGMLTKGRTACAGRHFLFYTLPVYYFCSRSTASVPLVHICLVCLGSDLTAASKTNRAEHFQILGHLWELSELLAGLRGCYARKKEETLVWVVDCKCFRMTLQPPACGVSHVSDTGAVK